MKEILIKKYDNRRLYCVEEARYVSLTEIRDFLQRGDKVKVVEKTTGKDITKYILMQVMLEDRYELVPTYFYQMMLQSPPEAIENFFQQFFPWMMGMYKNYQEGKFQMSGMNIPGMTGMPSMPSMPSMPFQNPWMQMPNPFQGMNPFMQTPAQTAQPQQSQGSANEASAKKTDGNAAKRDDDKMAEILKRLRELEEKLHSD